MDKTKITLVQKSFAKVAPISETAAELFYGKLFEMDPSLRPLFKGDMKEQGAKLMRMIGMAVNGLSNLEGLLPVVKSLGTRHVAYGVKDPDYDTVGSALIWTLGQGLGDDFTDDVKNAWVETYTTLATVMKDPANTP